MAQSLINKLVIIGHLPLKEEVLRTLAREGAVQVESLEEIAGPAKPESPEAREPAATGVTNRLREAIRYLESLQEKKKGFFEALVEGPLAFPEEDFLDYGEMAKAEGLLVRLEGIEEKVEHQRRRLGTFKARRHELAQWQSMAASPEELNSISTVRSLIGYLPRKALETVEASLSAEEPCWSIFPVAPDRTLTPIVVTAHMDVFSSVQQILSENDFSPLETDKPQLTPVEMMTDLEKGIVEMEEKILLLCDEARSILSQLNTLKIAHDYQIFLGEREKVQEEIFSSDWTFIISGWAREEDIPRLRSSLGELSENIELIDGPPGPEDNPPVSLKNSVLVEPFEMITGLYSLPSSKESDPTPYMAPFFALFFALCLTDGGYGAVMAAASYFALKKFITGKGGRQAFGLFFICGLATLAAGIITGSWFGDLPLYLPHSLKGINSLRERLTLFDPIKEPLLFMGLSLGVGFIQIWYGLGVKMFANFRKQALADGLLDQAPWLTILLGALSLTLTKLGFLPRGLEKPSLLTMVAGALVTLLFAGRQHKNIFKRLGIGLVSLYDIVGYASDVLSYSRLLALGLATAVIASVVNRIAFMSLSIPYIGFIFMFAILVAGHIFNLAINALGAFVHTCRLQFVEFLPKFFSGGGRPFRPFAIRGKFTRVK